jgi:hypothetical protein
MCGIGLVVECRLRCDAETEQKAATHSGNTHTTNTPLGQSVAAAIAPRGPTTDTNTLSVDVGGARLNFYASVLHLRGSGGVTPQPLTGESVRVRVRV